MLICLAGIKLGRALNADSLQQMPACTWGLTIAQMEAYALHLLLHPTMHAELAASMRAEPGCLITLGWPNYNSLCTTCQKLLRPPARPLRSGLHWAAAEGVIFEVAERTGYQQLFAAMLPQDFWQVSQPPDYFIVIFVWSVCTPTCLACVICSNARLMPSTGDAINMSSYLYGSAIGTHLAAGMSSVCLFTTFSAMAMCGMGPCAGRTWVQLWH